MKTKIIKLKNGGYARVMVKIRSRHKTKLEAEWADHIPLILSGFKSRNYCRNKRSSNLIDDQWSIKCATLACSWRKRIAVRVRTGGFLKSKSSADWYSSCRTMHSQFLKRISRLENYHEQWKYWANNKASNQAKRIRSREANLR